MDWNNPDEGEYFEIKKHVGALAIIAVNEYLPNFVTSMGPGQAVRAEVVVIDGPGEGARYPDALFFGKKIVPQMKAQVGSVVLGRIGQGQARPGQSPPYVLQKATQEDGKTANDWVNTNGPVESKPVDTSAGASGSYAPDDGVQWASQRQQPNHGSGHAQAQQRQYPDSAPPPSRPQVHAQPDEAPF